jgi:D-mannonate dehydratase
MIMQQLIKWILRTKNVNTKKLRIHNTQQNNYNDLIEEYKQTLQRVAKHGVTEESFRNLWETYIKFERARLDWVKLSLADALKWFTLYLSLNPLFLSNLLIIL